MRVVIEQDHTATRLVAKSDDLGEVIGDAAATFEHADYFSLVVRNLIHKHGIVVSALKHPDFEGIRVVPNVSLSVQEIDYFGDVMEDIVRPGR